MLDLTLPENRRKLFIEIALRRCRPGSGSSREFLQKRTWKRPVTNLKNLIKETSFVVVGGIATRLYMGCISILKKTKNLTLFGNGE
ncbi:MAG: hypothetical protein F6K35_40805 [Okeania sp. SIO2H7]|nr:hypothetical protein [Okeania sp. SIO2H7]